jgi:hypothetical protein
MLPASNDPTYLAQTSAAVYAALAAYDNTAIWLMQGWLFVNDPGFWKQPQIQAYLAGAPDNGTLILDLWSEAVPVWSKTQSYYGKPFIWCMLHDFGGNRDLFGNLDIIAQQPVAARNAAGSTMVGTGLTPEAIEQNPVMYELMTDMGWFSTRAERREHVARRLRHAALRRHRSRPACSRRGSCCTCRRLLERLHDRLGDHARARPLDADAQPSACRTSR